MTISSTTNRVDYVGTGTTGPFAYPFKVFAATDLSVTTRDATTGLETTLSYPTDFTATGVGNAAGGSITLTDALASGDTLTIRRVVPLTQPTSLRNAGTFFPATHEDAFDRLVMIAQQLQDAINRALKVSDTFDIEPTLPAPEASKALVWNATEDGLDNRTLDSSAIALPGQQRTVDSVSAYLDNNKVFNVADYGASPGKTSAENGAAIQKCLDNAGANSRIRFEAGNYACDRTLKYYSGQIWDGVSGSQVLAGQTTITFDDAVLVGIEPIDTAVDTLNVVLRGIHPVGGANTSPVINWYRTSYGRLEDICVFCNAPNGVGILMDSNVNNACYFNVLLQVKSLGHVGIRFQNGANANTVLGGRFGSGGDIGIEFLSLSTANLVEGADFEDCNTSAIHVDSTENRIVSCHFEVAPVGIDITANGGRTFHAFNTFATSVTTPVQTVGVAQDVSHESYNTAGGASNRWSVGMLRMASDWFTGSTPWDFDALSFSGTGTSLFRFFKNTVTTGLRLFQFYKGDGSNTITATIDAANGIVTALNIAASAGAGVSKSLKLQSNGVDRWLIQSDGTAESGGNAGSNLNILARADDGSGLFTPISINRSNGAVSIARNLMHSGPGIGFFGKGAAAQQTAIAAPSGGTTIDAEARAAITSLINVLKTFGFTA